MSNDSTPEFIEEADVNLAAIVHANVSQAKEAIRLMETSLEDNSDVYSIPRDIVVALVDILKTSNKMVTDMFEENSMFHDQAKKWQELRDRGRKGDPGE